MTSLPRRRSLVALGSLFAAPAFIPRYVHAQTSLPDTALRILVGFAAGGGSELMARVIAPRLQLRTGRRVTVENKPSGSGAPAGESLRKGLAEGSVVAFMPSTTLAATLSGKIFPFDSGSELVTLTVAGTFQLALAVWSKAGISTFADYVSWLKAGPPERLQLGTSASDAYLKIYSTMIGHEIGVRLQDFPQHGAAALVAAITEGRIPAGLGSVTTLLQHNRDHPLRILVTSGRQRVSVLRDVPTVVELGYPKLELEEWYGFFASSASPGPVAAEWSRQLRDILEEEEVTASLAQLGLDVETSTREQAAARFAAHLAAWKARKASFMTNE
jgi:tripartite-type tricarboxylate transporter receptor subunit TctC